MGHAEVGRPPRQQRSRRTLERIVEASRELIAEAGRDGLTVQEVVGRAGVSVGSFYARFAGREELLRHLDEEMVGRERARWSAELSAHLDQDAPLERRVRTIVDLLLSSFVGLTPHAHSHLRDAALESLLERRLDILHPDPPGAVALLYGASQGAIGSRPESWTDQRLADELARMWLGYLGRPSAQPAPDDRAGVDFFSVWA